MTHACGIRLSERTLGPACALLLAGRWPLLPWLPAEGPRGALPAPHGPHVPRKTCSPPAQIHPLFGSPSWRQLLCPSRHNQIPALPYPLAALRLGFLSCEM